MAWPVHRSPAPPPMPPLAPHLQPLGIYLDEIKRAADRGLAATEEAQLRDALRSVEYFHTLASDLLAKIEGSED